MVNPDVVRTTPVVRTETPSDSANTETSTVSTTNTTWTTSSLWVNDFSSQVQNRKTVSLEEVKATLWQAPTPNTSISYGKTDTTPSKSSTELWENAFKPSLYEKPPLFEIRKPKDPMAFPGGEI